MIVIKSVFINLLKELGQFLIPGGELILTRMCMAKDPSINLMNLWTSMKCARLLRSVTAACNLLLLMEIVRIRPACLHPKETLTKRWVLPNG